VTPVNRPAPQFAELLNRALSEPGVVSPAYTAFHGYSLGNQILALVQCADRGIPPGPIATFMGWKDKGRWVRKGEKALTLCMPVTCILGAIAEFERERIRERVLAGLQRARAQGTRLGRPRATVPVDRVQNVRSLSIDEAARTLGVSRSTLKRWRRQVAGPVY
jgi:hypothetical protein